MLIEAKDIAYRSDGKLILENVNFSVSKGEIVTIIGPNGSGKTTFARLCLGILEPTSGSIRRRDDLTIGYVPQRLRIEKSLPLSVRRFLSLRKSVDPEAITEALHHVGAAYLIEVQMGALSGGEMQRVLLARAILSHPDLLVLDEPAQGVDFAGEAALYELIGSLRDRLNCAILLISHDLHIVMAQSDRVICLNGHICCEGVPEQISTHPEYAKLFGTDTAAQLGLYAHRHDHEHHLCGGVHEGDCSKHQDAPLTPTDDHTAQGIKADG